MMEINYKVNWLEQLKIIADKCDRRPDRVTVRDLRDAVIYTYEALTELKEAESP